MIRYAGPRLIVRPYRRGASVNVRIADEAQSGPLRVYDVRYLVTQPDKWFDLRDYLTAADGSKLDDLPSFEVRRLDESHQGHRNANPRDRRGRHSHLALVLRVAGRAGGAVGIVADGIDLHRPAQACAAAPRPPPEPSLAQQIARYLEALARDGLPVADQARMEILLLRHWREQLSLRDQRMAAACRSIERDDRVGRAYAAVEAWLHDPVARGDPRRNPLAV